MRRHKAIISLISSLFGLLVWWRAVEIIGIACLFNLLCCKTSSWDMAEGVNMKGLAIAVALCFMTRGYFGTFVTRHKYAMDSSVTQLYCTPVETLESSVACARVVLMNASYCYGFVLDGGVCYRCRTMDISWPLSPEETLRTGTPLMLGM